MSLVNNTYEHKLAVAYYHISKRGLLMDVAALATIEATLVEEIKALCSDISKAWNVNCYVGKLMPSGDMNLNASKQLISQLKTLGYKVPRSRSTGEETSEKLALIRLYASTGDEAINKILRIAEIKKVLNTYVKANLLANVYYCQYNVAGTLSGRRSSNKHIFGLGNNAQNWPKYTSLGKQFRRCIISRPGKIFFSVDQAQAEDWAVVALSNNLSALSDLTNGVDRHKKLAAFLFSLPEDKILKHPHRFLGKKFRHANNYGMWKNTASENLAKEGFAFSPDECEFMLKKVNQYDPSIQQNFHKFVQEKIGRDRTLTTPLGRERIFLGLRPRGDNTRIFMEAYSYIPQSTVGDNTGLAVLELEAAKSNIVHECHDSITTELDDDFDTLRNQRDNFIKAFDRTIEFHTGIKVKIPIEGELGYNLKDTTEIKPVDLFSDSKLREAWLKVKEERELQSAKKDSGTVVA